jgi:hypothetical protein
MNSQHAVFYQSVVTSISGSVMIDDMTVQGSTSLVVSCQVCNRSMDRCSPKKASGANQFFLIAEYVFGDKRRLHDGYQRAYNGQ